MALYPGHIPTTALQKSILAIGSAAAAIIDPRRGDMVATFGEVCAQRVLPDIARRMQAHPVGARILAERPEVNEDTIDRTYFAKLPEGTFGRAYLSFLEKLKTSPDARPSVQFVDSVDLAYVMRRYRQTHDFYHVILEMPTTMLGEVTVKWWEALQLGLPMAITGGLFGAARLKHKHRGKYLSTYLPWVLSAAPSAEFFMNVRWEEHWDKTLSDLRQELKISQPPTVAERAASS